MGDPVLEQVPERDIWLGRLAPDDQHCAVDHRAEPGRMPQVDPVAFEPALDGVVDGVGGPEGHGERLGDEADCELGVTAGVRHGREVSVERLAASGAVGDQGYANPGEVDDAMMVGESREVHER